MLRALVGQWSEVEAAGTGSCSGIAKLGVVWVIKRANSARAQNTERDLEMLCRQEAKFYTLQLLKSRNNSSGVTQDSVERMDARMERLLQRCVTARTSEYEILVVRITTLATVAYLPGTLIATMFAVDHSKSQNSSTTDPGQFILIPKSNGSMSNLDQILALIGGIIVLLAAVRNAYRSRVKREQSLREVVPRRRSI